MLILNNAPSRVVTVSSMAHKYGTIPFDDLMLSQSYSRIYSYCNSKLANVVFSRELARRLSGTKVTTYSLHPGSVRTELARYTFPFTVDHAIGETLFYYLSWPLFKEPLYGAQTIICCAVSKELGKETGKYYSECEETEPVAGALDDNVSKRLWDVSIELVKLQTHEIHQQLR